MKWVDPKSVLDHKLIEITIHSHSTSGKVTIFFFFFFGCVGSSFLCEGFL